MKKLLIGCLAFICSIVTFCSIADNQTVNLIDFNNDKNFYYSCQGGLEIGPSKNAGFVLVYPFILQFGTPLNKQSGVYQLNCHGYENGVSMIGNDYLLVVGLGMHIIMASGYEVDPITQTVHTFGNQGGNNVGTPYIESPPLRVKR